MKSARTNIWLVNMLTEDMEAFFFCTSELKRQGKVRNRIVGGLVMGCIKQARAIPNEDVIHAPPVDGKKAAFVTSSLILIGYTTSLDGIQMIESVRAGGLISAMCIKLLHLSGWSEVQLLRRLGTKYGSTAGGLDRAQASELYGPWLLHVVGLETPLQQQSPESDDEEHHEDLTPTFF
ncbi:hypothetical protein R1flu_013667 [Riccia fluitans]|uniref:Uncharacterized protein n=1 Tax=Riccia fluitans TaxID=41844 RepID=A0ABD1YDZ6_9MARC